MTEYATLRTAGFAPRPDQLIGTLPFGIGAFLLSRHLPNTRFIRACAQMGRYSIGIYAMHLFVLQAVAYKLPITSLFYEIFDVILATAVTTALCIALANIPYVRALVR